MRSFRSIVSILMTYSGFQHDYQIGKMLGIKKSALSAGLKRNSIPWEEIVIFCLREKLNLNTLIGDREPGLKRLDSKVENIDKSKSDMVESSHGLRIPHAIEMDESDKIRALLELGRTWVTAEFPDNQKDLTVYPMESDNMNPTIARNELLLIDNRFRNISGDGVYALRSNGVIIIRRIARRLDGGLDLFSDNR
jgi:hypothetical protein